MKGRCESTSWIWRHTLCHNTDAPMAELKATQDTTIQPYQRYVCTIGDIFSGL